MLIVVAALAIAALTFGADRLFSGMTSAVERSQLDLMRSIISFNLAGTAANSLARAEIVAADRTVRKLVALEVQRRAIETVPALFVPCSPLC